MIEWAGKLLEFVLGSAAESVGVSLEHVKKQALARLNDVNPFREGVSANHDLIRAVRLAWIETALSFAHEAMRQRDEPEWAAQRADIERFDGVLRGILVDVRHAAFDRRTHPGDSAIDASLQAVLRGVPEFIGASTRAQPGRELTDNFEATLVALTHWRPAEIPAVFSRVAKRGLPTHGGGPLREFGELVFADFAETIKDPKRYPQAAQAFHVAMASMARELAQTTLDAVRGLDARLDAALPQLDALALLQRGLAQRLDRIGQQLDALPETTVTLLLQRMQDQGLMASAQRAGVERQTVIALARRLASAEVHDFNQAVKELERAVQIAAEVIARGAAGGGDAFVAEVLARVAQQTRAGQIDAGAQSVDDALAQLERLEAEQRAALLRSRRSLLDAGLQQDLLRRDAFAAARRIEAIAALGTPERPAWASEVLQRQQAYQAEGDDKGVNLSLAVAIEIARRLLETAVSADERIEARARLGLALRASGSRLPVGGALEEAVEVQRSILAETTRESAPQAWARARQELGRGLHALGERNGDAQQLEDALTAFRDTLSVYTRASQPLDWAASQQNIGATLWLIGMRSDDFGRLQASAAALREALKERTRARVPLEWAATQNNLAITLACMARVDGDTAKHEQAVDAFREALKERRRERVPLSWAATQNNLGIELGALGHALGAAGHERLRESALAFEAALGEWTRERVPLDWATVQHNLGGTLRWLGMLETDNDTATGALERSVTAYRDALKEFRRDTIPLSWAATQCDLGAALLSLGQRRGEVALLEQAVAAQRLGLLERSHERVPREWAISMAMLGNALEALATVGGANPPLVEAIGAYRAALTLFSAESGPDWWKECTVDLARAEALRQQRLA